jgi:DNA-binding MarR family transcriptional regulator
MNPKNRQAVAAADDTGLGLCLKLTRAYLNTTRRLDHALSGLHGLSFADFMILYYLERAPGAKLRRVDLAERLGLTASGATRSLLPLEKLGLVSRQPDPRDARVGYAVLTDSGRQLLDYAVATVREVAHETTAAIPTDRIDGLSKLLAQMAGMNSSNS